MYRVTMNKDISDNLFFVLERGKGRYSSDTCIADILGVSFDEYVERISKFDKSFILKRKYVYFGIKNSDGKKELINEFENEFIKELTTLELCGD